MRMDAHDIAFEYVTVLDEPMIFTCLRVDPKTIPEGLYHYEVRHDDEGWGDPVQIAEWVMVNHWGTLISATPIKLTPNLQGTNSYRNIDPEEDWHYEGNSITLDEYINKYIA